MQVSCFRNNKPKSPGRDDGCLALASGLCWYGMQGKKSQRRKGLSWSRLKRYRLLVLFAEFVLRASPGFLKGEDAETDFDF